MISTVSQIANDNTDKDNEKLGTVYAHENRRFVLWDFGNSGNCN